MAKEESEAVADVPKTEEVEWRITFEMKEHPLPQSAGSSNQQREITHAIARAIASIPAQYEELIVADYHVTRAGKDQPEVDAIHAVWGGDRKPR